MQLTYLIKNSETKKQFLDTDLPNEVTRETVGTYKADGGELYLLSFSVDGSTISDAKTLSNLRSKLRDGDGVRLLVDDASLKFATILYPRFAEYERKLRRIITLATCAEYDNFDNGLVLSLENLTLTQLGNQLFYDRSFQDKIKNKIKDHFTKDEINKYIFQLDENTVWSNLFGDELLLTVRKNYRYLCSMRNKVMHQRLITGSQYDCARKMLRKSIEELDTYTRQILSDVNYPKEHADCAAIAAQLVQKNYRSIFQNLTGSLEHFTTIASTIQNALNSIDTNSLASLATRMAEIQEAISANQALMASVQSVSSKIDAVQMPDLTSVFETIGQQTQLQKFISEEALSGLTRSSASLDWPELQSDALPSTDMFASSPLSDADSSVFDANSVNGVTSDKETIEEG